MTEQAIHELFNYGVLGVVLVFSAWALWRIVTYLADKLFDDPNGLVVQYIRDNRNFLMAMEKRDAKQQLLCETHADAMVNTNETSKHTADSLDKLVSLHEDPNSIFSNVQANDDIARLKHVAIEGCRMCRNVAGKWPEVADTVSKHCDAIERIVNDT